jgi:hypothetical protein
MSEHDDGRSALSGDEQRLVTRIRQAYAPEPLSPARRVALDEALRARTARRPRARWLAPALAAAAALAAVVAWWPQAIESDPANPQITALEWAAELEWEESIFFPDAGESELGGSEGGALPAHYQAIESLWLDG